ncbi:hypothetical protein JTB14_000906 [Gonioctena quinquepunctata]|nr:hypothetical protein JTB14_000906 [Gonioctena quinquepunctata]
MRATASRENQVFTKNDVTIGETMEENMKNRSLENESKQSEEKLSIRSTNYASIRSAKLRSKQREVEMQKLQLQMAQLDLEEIENEEKSETSSRHSNFKIESREVKDKEKYKYTEQWINQSNKFPFCHDTFDNSNNSCIDYYKDMEASRFDDHIASKNKVMTDDFSTILTNCMEKLSFNIEKLVAKQRISPLSEFYGDISDFPFWMNEFNCSTAENNISKAENLIRLQKSLKGRAREAVRDLYCSSENVDEIIETLKLSFGKTEWILMNLIEKAKRCSIPREDSMDSFVQFSIVVSNMVITMTNTGCEKYLENPELLVRLEEKLPINSKRSWALEKIKIKHANLKIFSDWLKNEVKLLMSVNVPPQINTIHKYPIHKKERILNVVYTEREQSVNYVEMVATELNFVTCSWK